ncbi:hypothetical protein ACT453_48330, partial [Bacillus sp. D-CC]
FYFFIFTVSAYYNKEELVKELQAVVDAKDVVLVKASRGMKLEEVITRSLGKLIFAPSAI